MRCTRPGCGKEFDAEKNNDSACLFHTGGPVFHEGLKSWSCCSDKNRAVTSFDDFMNIPGCASGSHSAEAAYVAPVLSAQQEQRAADAAATPKPAPAPAPIEPVSTTTSVIPPRPAHHHQKTEVTPEVKTKPDVVEQDPETYVPEQGAKCKRLGCNFQVSGPLERSCDECSWHPGVPLFHDASKGYSCCKPRVLEFEEFLKIKGCASNRHLFVGPSKDGSATNSDDVIHLRLDHYQTPTQVILSIFGKGADKEKSKVVFDHWELEYDIALPGGKRGLKKVPLYGPIDPAKSTFKVMSTKTECVLVKADGRSWPTIEFSPDLGVNGAMENLTFGVGGRTGTVGSKQISEAHRLKTYIP